MKLNFKEFVESASVAIILIFVLLPVRLVFVSYVSDNWFGSFGLITAISVSIVILAKKDKLGWFGRAFHRQMFKVHTGKRRYFVYTQLTLALLFFTSAVYAVELGDSAFEIEKEELKAQIDIDNIQELAERTEKEISIEDLPFAIYVFFYILIFRFDVYATIIATMNDISDGWLLHFTTVFLVEVIELIGILILTKFTFKKEKK